MLRTKARNSACPLPYYEGERGSKRYVNQPDFDTATAYLDKFCADRPLTIVALGAAQLVEYPGAAKALHKRKRLN
jgi:hypothetical protein